MPRGINEIKDFLVLQFGRAVQIEKNPLNIKFQIRYSVLLHTLLVQHKEKADEVNLRH